MSYEDRDTYGMYKSYDEEGPGPRLMGANTLMGEDVYNHKDEDLGDIKEIMLDMKRAESLMRCCPSEDFLASPTSFSPFRGAR